MNAVAICVIFSMGEVSIVWIYELTMTPLPKYFAKSNTPFGTRGARNFDFLEITGKNAPNMDPTMTMKTDAMRRPIFVVSPPPSPQLTSPSSLRNILKYIVGRLEVEIDGRGK